jgi:endonuclease-3 related protein
MKAEILQDLEWKRGREYMADQNHLLLDFYKSMLEHYGRQEWWPGESPFEVMVGAVLTQNTNWTNVEKAIGNLKAADVLDPWKLHDLAPSRLAELIRPAGYFNIKTKRLKNLIHWFCQEYGASIPALQQLSVPRLREELLSIHGIGRETADSIILYALEKPTFVIDTYTCRILVRHGCMDGENDYEEFKDFFERNLPPDVALYNEFHALIVQVGKNHCKPKPQCSNCPLEPFEHTIEI